MNDLSGKKSEDNQPVKRKEFVKAMEAIDKRFDGVDERFDGVDERFESVDERFDGVDKRFDGIDERLDAMDNRFDAIDKRFDGVDGRFDSLFGRVVQYVDKRISELEERMYTKADHAQFMVWMDEAMQELRDSREERKFSERQMLRLDDKVVDHEKRICVLEEK